MKKWAELNGWSFERTDDGGIGMSVSSVDDGEAPKPLDPTKLAALRTEEIALALADVDCRKDYQVVHDQVRDEVEKQFLADHRAELERIGMP